MSENVTTKTITVVQVGQDKTFVEVDANAKWSDVLAQVGGEGKKVTNAGTPLEQKASEAPADGDTVYVGPKSVKQG